MFSWFKRKPKHVQVPAKVGTIIDLVDDNGILVRKVILEQIEFDFRNGTTVQFVDYAKYLQKAAGQW